MKRTGPPDPPAAEVDELQPEYHFDYRKARPNRFALPQEPGSRVVVLDPDVAEVFATGEAVNSALRALMTSTPEAEKHRRPA